MTSSWPPAEDPRVAAAQAAALHLVGDAGVRYRIEHTGDQVTVFYVGGPAETVFDAATDPDVDVLWVRRADDVAFAAAYCALQATYPPDQRPGRVDVADIAAIADGLTDRSATLETAAQLLLDAAGPMPVELGFAMLALEHAWLRLGFDPLVTARRVLRP